jgi:hypothetical protein
MKKLTADEAVTYLCEAHGLRLSKRYLDNLAWSGAGPLFFKAGLRRLYSTAHLDQWAADRLGEPRRSTSDTSRAPVKAGA